MTNRGNTAASYSVKMLLNRALPPGFRSQLIVHRVYQTPNVQGCDLKQQTQNVLLVNLPNPSFRSRRRRPRRRARWRRAFAAAAVNVARSRRREPGRRQRHRRDSAGRTDRRDAARLRPQPLRRADLRCGRGGHAGNGVAAVEPGPAQGETTPKVAAPLLPAAAPPAAPAGALLLHAAVDRHRHVVGGRRLAPAGSTSTRRPAKSPAPLRAAARSASSRCSSERWLRRLSDHHDYRGGRGRVCGPGGDDRAVANPGTVGCRWRIRRPCRTTDRRWQAASP